MKILKCQDCKRTRIVENNILFRVCPCGGAMILVEEKLNNFSNKQNKRDQVILKEVFQIGVNKGKPLLAEDLVNSIKPNKIIINP